MDFKHKLGNEGSIKESKDKCFSLIQEMKEDS
jgi:hypothetical protein